MDRGIRITLALSLILAGVVGALLFPQAGSQVAKAPTEFVEPPLVLRDTAPSPTADLRDWQAPQLPRFSGRLPAHGEEQPATVVLPARVAGPPPSLPPTYPGADQANWGAAMTLGPALAAAPPPKLLRHKIIDGDTLPSLAQKYLGAKDRYLEIFELNRDILKSPDLLPIGKQLKIPARPSDQRL
jgi:nucleoid-associated protein YgaU